MTNEKILNDSKICWQQSSNDKYDDMIILEQIL